MIYRLFYRSRSGDSFGWRNMGLPIRLGLLAMLAAILPGQTKPDIATILQKISQTYKAATQYEFVADATQAGDGGKKLHTVFAFRPPGQYRMEGPMPGGGSGISDTTEVAIVHDGRTVWFYNKTANMYRSLPAEALYRDTAGGLQELRPEIQDQMWTTRYRGATDFVAGAVFLREETIDVSGAKVACYVLSVSRSVNGFAYTWWVDKETYRILREDDAGNSAVFTTVKLGEPLPDELFEFKAPPGATRAEALR